MEPVIKVTRISPSSFSLDLRQSKAGQQFQPVTPAKPKPDLRQPIAAGQNSGNPPATVAHEPILTEAAIDKLVPRTVEPEAAQESMEEKKQREQEREKRELEQAHEQARQEGYQAGLEAGLEAAKEQSRQELDQALNQIKELLHSLKDLSASLFQEMEDSAAEVIFEGVTKIIGYAAIDQQLAYSITREAIEQVKDRNRLIVRVSIKDYEMVQLALSQTGTGDLLPKNLTVVADNLVQLGGCVVETEAGSLDARLEIQLQRLKETLLGVRKSNDDA